MERPATTEYSQGFAGYIGNVTVDEPLALLEAQIGELRQALGSLSEEKSRYRYADGKWSIRQIVGHLIDGERILGYRALAAARGETAALPAFEEDDYARTAGHDDVPLAELLDELELVRKGTILMFRHLPDEAWTRIGTANAKPFSARAMAFVIPGHTIHHLRVLRERYGV